MCTSGRGRVRRPGHAAGGYYLRKGCDVKTKLPNGVEVDMSDFLNPDDHGVWNKCYWIHDHGFTLAIVFADSEQDALDEAFDHGNLDHFRVMEDDRHEHHDDDSITYLGNNSTMCDIACVSCDEFKLPSIVFMWGE